MDEDNLDAFGMAELVRRREVAPDYFVRQTQARIAALNPILNAVVHEFEMVMPEALDGLFAGVPLLLKDTGVAVKGVPLTSGSRLHAEVISPADSTLGTRLRQAGFVFAGRTNTPELALSFTTEGRFHGPARNPWDLSRTPGGSSGGAAAVVAAGIVPMSQCSDGAGSIRVPAAHCGVFGMKPSRLRNPSGPALAEGIAGMSTPHAISRSVRDNAMMLDATHGADIGDPWASPPVEGSFLDAVSRPPRALRIGMEVTGNADCRAAVEAAARLCESLGHHVELAAPQYDREAIKNVWFTISAVSVSRGVRGLAAARGIESPLAMLEPVNAEWVRKGDEISGTDYLGAVSALHQSSRAMGRYFSDYDIYLSPTTAEVAPKLGWLSGEGMSVDAFFERFWAHAPLTAVFNASGCPAMSVPLHWTETGLPVGVQFGAAYGAEALLFSLAGQLEMASPWARRRPQINEVKR
ncbi:6-aminohexanoate hydrolase [Pararhizobium polonicum]|uniref:6-aminohexanoate hydrolase n=1 Tax=Pararhizobium polonicum TaxID=1612624 RepID=A0A1C7P7E2_9HYPH|nr:amidase [Pararhizobium polonicum]OBZ95634.1 6-aminohexanoate hydrolase [Pararhizobium polonicum]